ncbi:TIGR03857 family LLM class F420-dependent oxidoreductase [Sphingobium phenoxybenzoativorans]|uniref:TIGR03857 family LLM class F420-dependent oxidoreductase n=1 Tax=Sphingobium phenoxybenzoativorans TaxID=1592790 RepID=A0A975K9D5_9SPHN|nr:TIGR03857 family LLM class F420-dependent oxidoreductase [Sphingobium phenoxybenzoativorans]QUT07215.1 TIGR03857 family LLM class F420-dependent oxidoreductase [Sphingobium phenoxybenzoativorans]
MMALSRDRIYSYVLPGQVSSPDVVFGQAEAAEALGLGGIFLSERWESKELGATMGALSRSTRSLMLVAGLTHFGTRHPVVQAGMAQTLQMLSGGRYVLGYGRGVPSHFKKLGIPIPNLQGMADYVMILRKLWAGETVRYSGPAGEYPELQLPLGCENPPPIIIGTIGPKTLALAGQHFDGVVLHPFLTTQGVARSIKIVRDAAVAARRDPAAVKIYATVITVPDSFPEDMRIDMLEARAVSYFMHPEVGAPVVAANGWSEAPMHEIAATGLARLEYGTGNPQEKRRAMAEVAGMLPQEWLETGAATGSVAHCIGRLQEYVDAGVDYILLHGTTPDMQADIIAPLGSA